MVFDIALKFSIAPLALMLIVGSFKESAEDEHKYML